MIKSFIGGIFPQENKDYTNLKPIEDAMHPLQVTIPLIQHYGAPCEPLVKVGDHVKIGQKIGSSNERVSSPVHASISGAVMAIEPRACFKGEKVNSIVIDSDLKKETFEGIKPPTGGPIEAIREAGIVGLGGATFPTHVKLSPPEGKKISTIIINGAECEPYITCDHRIMLDETYLVAHGIDVLKKIFPEASVFLAIEGNKKNAINLFRNKVQGTKTVELKTKYPQGSEKQLIRSITGKEVPKGGLPYDVGVIVVNVGTCAQIAKTIKTGMPLIERIVTVTGRHLAEPKNLRVRIGTLFSDLVKQCGGVNKGRIKKVIAGGPMMGVAVSSLDIPVVKATSGIIVMTEDEALIPEAQHCIRCKRCVDQCPQYLLPNLIADYSEHNKFDKAQKLGAADCIECGACSYVCVTKRHLAQLIKLAKNEKV